MIWHFFEVWMVFLVVFAFGCGLGAMLHVGLAAGPMALAQETVADAVGNTVDHLKWRLGMAPDWRPEFRRRTRTSFDLGRARDEPSADDSPGEAREGVWNLVVSPFDEPWVDDEWSKENTPEAHASDHDDAEAAQLDAAGFGNTESGGMDMMRPAGLSEPRAGVPDNLQRIWGIGKRNEALLNSLGIYHFGQIASWTPAEARWVASRLTFPERLERDNWIGQAIVLATGGDPSTVSPTNRKKMPDTGEH